MSEENLELDHVLLAVADLEVAAREIEARYGLTSVEGGRHPGWGTANRIVPLGETYLELITVIDEAEAAQSRFGSWVAAAQPALARPLGWAVRTNALDDVARRLGLAVSTNSRATRSGQLLRWRVAGIEQAVAEPWVPIIIEWGAGTPLPGETPTAHPAGRVRITKLQLTGDEDRVAAWLGTHHLPIEVRPGTPGLVSITLTGPADEIVIDARHL
jgi:Glyoxalase-like domain